jgi:hypothetical protein
MQTPPPKCPRGMVLHYLLNCILCGSERFTENVLFILFEIEK